ncbi:MAG: SIS domain-containing protein [Oligoflexales bacterium]
MKNIALSALQQGAQALDALMKNEHTLDTLVAAAKSLSQSLELGHKVYSCGNGGSFCDAAHFAEELSGRFRQDRKALAAMAISDGAHISCAANDFGYENVYSRFLEAHAQPGDHCLLISTSGRSPNIINAAKAAKASGATVISLTGKKASPLSELSDFDICTPGGQWADRVQELHIKCIHILIEMVETTLNLHPNNS